MKSIYTTAIVSLVATLMTGLASIGHAKNIDLVTLPNRESVELTIYNSEDLTMAKEMRFITLKKGINQLQFSWAGTLIDPTSVRIKAMEHADEIDVLDTVFPGQKPNHLIWNIRSDIEGQVPVVVSYFTSGLTWKMDYVAIANPDETKMHFRGHVRVFNNSGEEYENAEIRMIVGKINLVEKIAQLAAQQGIDPDGTTTRIRAELRRNAAEGSFAKAGGFGGGGGAKGAKEIVKEGLSEDFMFSVEGSETIRNGWSKRMKAVDAEDVKFDIVYRMRNYQYGPRPVRFFNWKNDEEHELGDSPMPNGLVRIFRENGQGGLSYLGQQSLEYVPVQAKIEVNLGHDDLVVYQRRQSATKRSDFQFHRISKTVTGWNEARETIETVRNYRDKPIHFELRLRIGGDVELKSQQEITAFDFNTVEAKFSVPAGQKHDVVHTNIFRHGSNAKQNRVKILPPQ